MTNLTSYSSQANTFRRTSSLSVVSVHPSTSSSKSSFTSRPSFKAKSYDPWTQSPPSSRGPSLQVLPNVLSLPALPVVTTSWLLSSPSRKVTTLSNIVFPAWTARIAASTQGRYSCRRAKESRLVSLSRSASSDKSLQALLSCMRMCSMLVTRMFAPSTPKTHVSSFFITLHQ